MDRNRSFRFACALFAAASLTLLMAAPVAAQSEIVLHAKNASTVMGDWQVVADTSAAGGSRMWNPNRGAAKVNAPSANPYDYFELTFNAEAGRGYRLWLRGKAEKNAWTNDSVHVQFSGSVYASGGAAYRIGSTYGTIVNIEACGGCGLYGWGWEDNGYAGNGALIYFAATGPQTIRIQRREDGVSIDQVVLSAVTYLAARPGAAKADTTVLAESSGVVTTSPVDAPATTAPTTSTGAEIIIPVAASATVRGNWQIVSDTTAAGGAQVWNPNKGAGKPSSALAAPTDYFDVSFNAEAGRAYRLWIRGKAEGEHWTNDSAFVQFSGSLNVSGAPAYRIGTTSAAIVSVESCSGCGTSKWGWVDNGYDGMGPLVSFATTGPQLLRVQRREDGVSIDQIVLSASNYLTTAPGAAKNDATILTGSTSGATTEPDEEPVSAPAPAPEPEPEPTPTPAPTGPVKLRVMEYNIHHGVGSDNVYNLDRLANWMVRVAPDVILLNESERYTSWGNEDQPARFKAMLEAKTGKTWHMFFSQEYGQWTSKGKGHTILSLYPLETTSHVTITPSDGLNGAGAIQQARITVNGRTINFLLTHLDPYDPAMRLIQARDVINWSAGHAENRILVGDMNAWPDQASIAELNKTYYDAWTVAAAKGMAKGISDITPFGATKKGRIDYIFYSKNAPNLVVLDAQTPDTRDANGIMPSDHRPVVVTFEVR